MIRLKIFTNPSVIIEISESELDAFIISNELWVSGDDILGELDSHLVLIAQCVQEYYMKEFFYTYFMEFILGCIFGTILVKIILAYQEVRI